MENDALDLGTEFRIDLSTRAANEASYTVQQLITALNATTTLTTLDVHGPAMCEPHIQQRVVEPLCRCLANLRLQNENHPLKAVDFQHLLDSDIIRQFLVALKQFGIRHVTFQSIDLFPVHFLMDFCHDNSNLKVLILNEMNFTDEVVADPIGGSAATTNLNLDTLHLYHVIFTTSFAATNFAHLLAHMNVAALEVGELLPQVAETDENLEYVEESVDGYDGEVTKRIVSGFTMPSVEQLTLCPVCEPKNWEAALDAGMAAVTRLTVQFERYREEDNPTEKLQYLARMIRGAVKLNFLTIDIVDYTRLSLTPPRQLLQALEACASVTEIHVNNNHGGRPYFTEPEVQHLRRITARNSELGQFVANPITFPNDKLLTLMSQFNDCPSGLYMVARRLPEVFSFDKGSSLFPSMDPNPTRKLRKRSKNFG